MSRNPAIRWTSSVHTNKGLRDCRLEIRKEGVESQVGHRNGWVSTVGWKRDPEAVLKWIEVCQENG